MKFLILVTFALNLFATDLPFNKDDFKIFTISVGQNIAGGIDKKGVFQVWSLKEKRPIFALDNEVVNPSIISIDNTETIVAFGTKEGHLGVLNIEKNKFLFVHKTLDYNVEDYTFLYISYEPLGNGEHTLGIIAGGKNGESALLMNHPLVNPDGFSILKFEHSSDFSDMFASSLEFSAKNNRVAVTYQYPLKQIGFQKSSGQLGVLPSQFYQGPSYQIGFGEKKLREKPLIEAATEIPSQQGSSEASSQKIIGVKPKDMGFQLESSVQNIFFSRQRVSQTSGIRTFENLDDNFKQRAIIWQANLEKKIYEPLIDTNKGESVLEQSLQGFSSFAHDENSENLAFSFDKGISRENETHIFNIENGKSTTLKGVRGDFIALSHEAELLAVTDLKTEGNIVKVYSSSYYKTKKEKILQAPKALQTIKLDSEVRSLHFALFDNDEVNTLFVTTEEGTFYLYEKKGTKLELKVKKQVGHKLPLNIRPSLNGDDFFYHISDNGREEKVHFSLESLRNCNLKI